MSLREALDRAVLVTLSPVALVLVLLFAIFVVFDLLVMPGQARWVVVGHDVILGLVFLGSYLVLRRGLLPARWANPAGAAFVLLTCSNNLVTLGLAGSIVYTPMLMIIMVGAGAMLISMPWLLVSLCGCFAGWLMVAWSLSAGEELMLYCIFMVVAFAAGVSLQVGRIRNQRRLHAALGQAREARQTAERLAREAREASRAKGEFLANMSHEIRTPIHGVLGMAEILLTGRLETEARERVEILRESARALLELVNDVLDFSKVEAGQMLVEQRVFAPQMLMDEIGRLLEPLARDKGLVWTLELDPELPRWLNGDPAHLRQVLVNLMGNAVKFTERGQVKTTLQVASRGPGRRLGLRVKVDDSGPGVSEDTRQQLFDPFFQQDTSTQRQHGGTGLGLAIARQLVRLMGGQIGVADSPLGGARFWFSVEVLEDAAPDLSGVEEVPRGQGGRVLVVDDHKINRQVAQAALERFGYAVTAVESGPAALVLLERQVFDLVLLDVQMPGMDGLDVVRRIRESDGGVTSARVPVLAVTAHATEDKRQAFLQAGMDGFVAKPFEALALARVVAEHLVGKG